MKTTAVVVLLCALLGGCNHAFVRGSSTPTTAAAACPALDNAAEVQLGLVRQMQEQGRSYAGLAHLAALDLPVRSSAAAIHLQAELLRHTGKLKEAERRYRELLGGCLAGRGHHGLGLLAGTRDLPRAVAELSESARLLPTDPRVRNDLGYVLLLSQDLAGARREFMTAVELGDYRQRAASNLLLLSLYEGDLPGAERLRRHLQLTDTAWEQLQRQAAQLHSERKMHTDGEG